MQITWCPRQYAVQRLRIIVIMMAPVYWTIFCYLQRKLRTFQNRSVDSEESIHQNRKNRFALKQSTKKKKMWLHFVWHVQRWFYSFQMLFKWSLRYIFYLLTIDLLMMSIFNIFFRERNGPRKNVQHLTDKLTRCLLIDSNHMHKSYANKNSSLTKYYKRYNKRFNTTFTTK